MGVYTCEEIQNKAQKLKDLIAAWEDALLAFATTNAQSYTLNTGQSTQTVTRADVDKIDGIIDSLENRLSELCLRYPDCLGTSGGAVIARPHC